MLASNWLAVLFALTRAGSGDNERVDDADTEDVDKVEDAHSEEEDVLLL